MNILNKNPEAALYLCKESVCCLYSEESLRLQKRPRG